MPVLQEPTLLISDKPGFFILNKAYIWQEPNTGIVHVVPAGFETNLASVPWCLDWYFERNGISRLPAIKHDWDYSHGEDRKEADRLFYVGLLEQQMRPTQAKVAYRALRMTGGIAWRRGHKR